jgi:hypothetical protein
MARQLTPNGTLIYRVSHRFAQFRTGHSMGQEFAGPVVFKLDSELRNGDFPTFYTSPVLVARNKFVADLRSLKIDNIETYPAIIEDRVDGRKFDDYTFVNIIGAVACTDEAASEIESIGPDMNLINSLVLVRRKVPDFDLFLVAEDTSKMIVSERVYQHLSSAGYPDIFLEEVRQT